jgi:cobalt-zinc-cadmium efflux system outer membrane protein
MRRLVVPVLTAVVACRTNAAPARPAEVAAPAPALGASAPPAVAGERPPLTLADLEKLALAGNPTIQAAAALVQQQQGLLKQAGLYPNPAAGYVRTDPDQPGQSETQGLFLSQEFVTAGKLRLARAAGTQDVERSNWQLEAQRARVLNDVRIRYYETLGAQQAVLAAGELERLADEGVRVTRELVKAGQGTRPDVLQAELQRDAVRIALQDAKYRLEAAWRQLANVVGIPGLQPAALAGSLEGDIPHLDWQTSLRQLLAASPVLRAQEAEIRAAAYELKLARAQAIPNVNVQVVAQRDHVLKFSTVSTLVSLPVPLFNRNQGNVLNAEGLLLQQQKEYERVQLALTDQLAVSFRQYLTLRNQVERVRQEILPRARQNLDLTSEAYRAGRFDFLRVLTARQTWFQTNLAYVDALTELHKVAIEITGLQLTGGLNPTEVGTALQTAPGAGAAGARNVLLQQLQEQRGGTMRTLPGALQAGER